MAMDMLRTCYTSYMRLYPDDPDRLTLMRWQWCPEGALDLPFPHAFLSYTGDTFRDSGVYPIGEIPGIVGFSSGKISPRYKGQNFCGREEWFQLGSPLSARGTPRVDGDGIPVCCSTTGPPLGGVLTSGFGTFSSGVEPWGHGHGLAVAALHGHGTGRMVPVLPYGHGHGLLVTHLAGGGTGHTPIPGKGSGHGLLVTHLAGGGTGHAGTPLGTGDGLAAVQLVGGGTGHATVPTLGSGHGLVVAAITGAGTGATGVLPVGHGAAVAPATLAGGGTGRVRTPQGHGGAVALATLVGGGAGFADSAPVGHGGAVALAVLTGKGDGFSGYPPVSYLGDTVAGSAVIDLNGAGPWPGLFVGEPVSGAGIPGLTTVLGVVGNSVFTSAAATSTNVGALYSFG